MKKHCFYSLILLFVLCIGSSHADVESPQAKAEREKQEKIDREKAAAESAGQGVNALGGPSDLGFKCCGGLPSFGQPHERGDLVIPNDFEDHPYRVVPADKLRFMLKMPDQNTLKELRQEDLQQFRSTK
ncbi:hypothetical protein [Serratia proteamaculans]|uniref:hypothetical protein n=1 Tax=Serratia proteamaculans TaxID=28151 RepID=UPI003D060AFE